MGDSGTPSAFTKPDIGRGWLHALTIYRIEHGHTRRELTTGGDVTPTPCACYYAGSTWHDGPMVREYHLERIPDCPLHWCPSWLAPCTCHYGLHTTSLPYQVSQTRVRRRRVVLWSYFTIDRDCLHHGDTALIYPIGEPVDPRFWETLDELERGH